MHMHVYETLQQSYLKKKKKEMFALSFEYSKIHQHARLLHGGSSITWSSVSEGIVLLARLSLARLLASSFALFWWNITVKGCDSGKRRVSLLLSRDSPLWISELWTGLCLLGNSSELSFEMCSQHPRLPSRPAAVFCTRCCFLRVCIFIARSNEL